MRIELHSVDLSQDILIEIISNNEDHLFFNRQKINTRSVLKFFSDCRITHNIRDY